MIDSFKKNSRIFLENYFDRGNSLEWLSLMQHYGAPTRLLDFSYSPYIALYFAIRNTNNDAAIFCIKHKELIKKDKTPSENIGKKFIMNSEKNLNNTILMPFEPSYPNERLYMQQGLFLVPNSLNFSHSEILNGYGNDDFFFKIKIAPCAFQSIITELQKMNITAINIFPGFEGFCKSYEDIGVLSIRTIRPISKSI